MSLDGLAVVNVELTSRCGKFCHMCGRRKVEKETPELANWGDMPFDLVADLARQLPPVVIQFHNNGEPLLYPKFGEAVAMFKGIKCINTNGKLLGEKADEIIDNLDTIAVSVFEGDTEALSQRLVLREFIRIKGDRKPQVIIRCLGKVNWEAYQQFGIIAKRTFHSPMGSFDYKTERVIPEIGICLDALSHLSISRTGEVSMCVRFDPLREGVIGDATRQTLDEIWNGEVRRLALQNHIEGHRERIPLCRKCRYWGIPG